MMAMKPLLVVSVLAMAMVGVGCGTNPSWNCQAECTNAQGNPSAGFESYQVEADTKADAEGECEALAAQDVAAACGTGNTYNGTCTYTPTSE